MKQNIKIGGQEITVKFSFFALREFFRLTGLDFERISEIQKNALEFIEPLIIAGICGAELKPADDEMKQTALKCMDEMNANDLEVILGSFTYAVSQNDPKNQPKGRRVVRK